MKKSLFKLLAKVNKIILASYSKKQLEQVITKVKTKDHTAQILGQ